MVFDIYATWLRHRSGVYSTTATIASTRHFLTLRCQTWTATVLLGAFWSEFRTVLAIARSLILLLVDVDSIAFTMVILPFLRISVQSLTTFRGKADLVRSWLTLLVWELRLWHRPLWTDLVVESVLGAIWLENRALAVGKVTASAQFTLAQASLTACWGVLVAHRVGGANSFPVVSVLSFIILFFLQAFHIDLRPIFQRRNTANAIVS